MKATQINTFLGPCLPIGEKTECDRTKSLFENIKQHRLAYESGNTRDAEVGMNSVAMESLLIPKWSSSCLCFKVQTEKRTLEITLGSSKIEGGNMKKRVPTICNEAPIPPARLYNLNSLNHCTRAI